MSIDFRDLRGIRDLKVALLKSDTAEELTYETPIPFGGVASVSSEANESSATKYYDNGARIVTTAEGEDNYTLATSIIDDLLRSKFEGRIYDEATGMLIGTPKKRPYVAVGFVAEDTSGNEYGYWILKGKVTGGNETMITKDDGTESNGTEWNYASVYTNHKFAKAQNQPVKFTKVDLSKVDETTFFSKVTTPDEVVAKSV